MQQNESDKTRQKQHELLNKMKTKTVQGTKWHRRCN